MTLKDGSGSRKRRASASPERSSSNPRDGKSNEKNRTSTKKSSGEAVYSTHDPACDVCRFKKIKCDRETPNCLNCVRGEINCIYSDRGKRTNQTKRLIDDLGEVRSRLERLETAVVRRVNLSEGYALGSSESVGWVNLMDHLGPESAIDVEFSDSVGPRGSFTADSRLVVRGDDGNEKYHGSTSTMQLLREVHSALDTKLSKQPPSSDSTREKISLEVDESSNPRGFERFQLSSPVDLSHDEHPLSRPPKGLLNALIEPYFQQIHPVFPIFSRDRFLQSIEQSYAAPVGNTDTAWVLAFNNVTLQSLNEKSRSTGQDPQQPHLNTLETELIRPFIINSRRAFAHTDILLKPRLISVQALMSFSLVALDNLEIETAQLLIEQACQVARSMGLHQQMYRSEGYSRAEIQERRNAFWTLSVLEKHFSLLTGKSCCLPSYDCDVMLPEVDPTDQLQKFFLARIGLALFQERIYINLYSANGLRSSEAQRQVAISRLNVDLRHWYEGFEEVLLAAKSDLTSAECVPALEVEFMYHNCCIMVHRRSIRQPDKVQCLKEARKYLHLLEVLKSVSRVEKDAVLRRAFQMYPPAAFLELLSNLVKGPQHPLSDIGLLQNALEVLRDVVSADHPRTYCYKLYTALSRCTATATDLIQRMSAFPTSHTRPGTRRTLSAPSTGQQCEPQSETAVPSPETAVQVPSNTFAFQNPHRVMMALGNSDKVPMTPAPPHEPRLPATAGGGGGGPLDPLEHMDLSNLEEDYAFGASFDFGGRVEDPFALSPPGTESTDIWAESDLWTSLGMVGPWAVDNSR